MKKSKKIIIAIILIIMGTIGFLYLKNEYNKDFDGTSISGYVLGKGIAPDLTPEEIKALLQKEVDASKIAFSIYSEAIFNGKVGTIMFANPKYNAYDIDLEVKVDNKVIIRTEKIAPDQYIEKIELIGKALKKGKYNATGRKTGEVMGEVNVDITLISN